MGGRVESQGCFFPENDFILRSHWNLCWIHYIAKKKHHNIQGGSFKQKLYKNFGMFCCHSLSAKHLAKNSPFHCPMHSNPPRWELPTKAESRPPATAPACRPTKIQLPKKKHDCIGVDHVASWKNASWVDPEKPSAQGAFRTNPWLKKWPNHTKSIWHDSDGQNSDPEMGKTLKPNTCKS